jgi:hypothetical protein
MNNYPIKIEWEIGDGYGQPWNELCAVIIEKFGLPGNKYTTEVTNHWMIFHFKEQEDQLMAKLTLGDTGGCD